MSAYADFADNLRDMGYHPMPAMPGAKVPGQWDGAAWRPMGQWSKWCDQQPPDFLHQKWTDWPDAGLCVAHGAVVGLDVDTDDGDVAAAALSAAGPSPVRRRGRKGWMGYYRPSGEMGGHTARVRWYRGGDIVCELLLHGTQSVIPPTIHPQTGQPYVWLTADSLEDTSAADLPELPADIVDRLDAAFAAVGVTRQAPRRVNGHDYKRTAPTAHDLEKPWGRSINDRAMEAAAIDLWWPALNLPKSRRRSHGSWEAVAWWRPSNSGRANDQRNPNMKVVPGGIVDFGADRSYTPIDLVMAARDCSVEAAGDWLAQFIRPEGQADFSAITAPPPPEEAPQPKPEPPDTTRWAATPVFLGGGRRSTGQIKPVAVPSDAAWEAMVPREAPPFPVQDLAACEGLLGEVAAHIDAASATHTEAGALAVALPLLGAVMGQAYETPTGLRTNIYTVALGRSGSGKTSLVNPAKELMLLGQQRDVLGEDRFASGPGILRMLTDYPRRISFLDEFGHMLQQLGSPGAGIHSRQILTEFTALYSAANTVFTGTAYASREPTPIDCPHLCLFGMATPDQFWRAFGSSSLEDGSVARYLVFPLGQTAPQEPDRGAENATAEAIKHAAAVIAGRPAGNLGRRAPLRVMLDPYAEEARRALKDKESGFAEYAERNSVRGGGAILRRVTENALKIALVSAAGRNPERPEIDSRDIDIGHAIAWWSAALMIRNIASHVADNQYERDVNDVERIIREAGPRGITMAQIGQRTRSIQKRTKAEILEALEEAGAITCEVVANPAGGRPSKVYRGT